NHLSMQSHTVGRPVQDRTTRVNMKSCFVRLTFLCSLISLYIIVYSYGDTKLFMSAGKYVFNVDIMQKKAEENSKAKKENSLKYILQWTSDSMLPFADMGKGQNGFVDRKCPHTNCFVTSNESYLGDYTKFNAIAFAGPDLSLYNIKKPKRRSPHQKYVFGSIESSMNYPIDDKYDGFFNWTWTYKLDSEVHWGYIVVRDIHNNIIGPRKDMNWLKPDEMTPVSNEVKTQLKTKRKAAAWYVSNCNTQSKREVVTRELQKELGRYLCMGASCTIDVYGACGPFKCSRDKEFCNKKIAMTYYFYLSFENALSEDYELGVVKLAAKMHELMNNPEEYAKYFRWKNHYYYHRTTETVETNEYCRFCALLNDEKSVREISVYNNFREWWNSG
ncbi:Uncharacterized protein OBRU01_15415, partial [Operophtera brumata]